MKIQKIYIKNFKNIAEIEKDLNGKSIWVIAQNGKGKTSFIQSMFSTLSGKEAAQKPLMNGEEKGLIQITLGEDKETKYIVELKFSEKNQKGTLTVSAPDGTKFSSPREFLNKMVGDITFNPFDLLRLKPKELMEKVKQLVGLDLSDLDVEYDKKFNERTIVNREVDNYTGLVNKSGLTTDDFEKYKEEIDIVALTEEKNGIYNSQTLAKGLIDASERLIEKEKENDLDIKLYEEQIKQLQQKIEDKKKENETMKVDYLKLINDPIHNKVKELLPRLMEIDTEILDATDHNNNHKKVLETKNAKDTLKEKEKKADELTKELEDIKSKKKKRIKEVKMPVEGLEFATDGLLYNGLPFDETQINKAKIIEVGYKLSTALHKDLQIMRVDGSVLDDNSIKGLLEFVEERGYQVFIEQVDNDAEKLQLKFVEE